MYQDEKGEWVLMETYGPGCLYNFTQHRYPASPVPVFRFYLDDENEPKYEIKPGEFDSKAPFVKPLADIMRGRKMEEEGLSGLSEALYPWSLTSTAR